MEIKLRPMTSDDIDDEYLAWFNNEDGHLDYFTNSRRSFDRDSIVSEWESNTNSGRYFTYLISAGSAKIGTVKLGPIDDRNMTSDLVCLIGDRNFLGYGLASQAITIGNNLAFNEHKLRRLHGGMYAENVPSIRSYIKAGWHVEGRLKGYYLVDGQAQDRICVACLNPSHFDEVVGPDPYNHLDWL